MPNEVKCWCRHCKKELPPNHTGTCPYCGKSGKDYTATINTAVEISSRLKVRKKRKGVGRFVLEILQGRFPSGDSKLKKGVDKVRIVDREKKEYHEVVENAATGEIIREVHEPLSQHRRKPKKRMKMDTEEKKYIKSTAGSFASLSLALWAVALIGYSNQGISWATYVLVIVGVITALFSIYIVLPLDWKQSQTLRYLEKKYAMDAAKAVGWFAVLAAFAASLILTKVLWLMIIGIILGIFAYVILLISVFTLCKDEKKHEET
jgi:cation transport ATPase